MFPLFKHVDSVRRLWKYRGFILGSVKREFQSKYRNSMLGMSWVVLQPLAMIIVYTVIFSQIMKARLPGIESSFGYSIYLCVGIIFWGMFSEIVSRSQTVFIDNANLLKKIKFPRICLPIIIVLSSGLNFAIIFSLFMGFLFISGNLPGLEIMAIFPVLIIQVMFGISLGIILGVLNVFFRDIGQLFGIILQFWFWLTPIIYPINILPESIQSIMQVWNPMVPIIQAYQAIFVTNNLPDWNTMLIPSMVAIALSLFAMNLYRKHADEMVDEL
jgi:lipopolysaccharide transport system permease protein